MNFKIKHTTKLNISIYKFGAYIAFGVFIFTLLTQIYVANQLTVKGNEIIEMADKRSELHREISLLELEIAGLASLNAVENRAQEMGFVKNTEYVASITSERPTASLYQY